MRLRKEQPLDPEIIRELEAFEAEFAVALHEERPLPSPGFALDLDLRVRDGFPAPEPATPRRRPSRVTTFRRRWALALGTAASVFIVATAVLVSGGGDGRPNGGTVSNERESTPYEVQGSEDRATSPPLPGPSGAAPSKRERQQERAAALTLAPPRDEIEDVADQVIRVTDRHGGFVLNSTVLAGEAGNARAELDLRIPSARLETALADLSELAHVRRRGQDTRDITAEFTSPRRRLADALGERRALLRRLARATTPNETAAIRARLRATNRRIDRAQAQLRRLRERVSFSAVSVSIEPGSGSASADSSGWSLGDALDDALGVLRAVVGGALVALAVLVPLGILAAVAWLVYGSWLRRRREQALEM